MISFFFFFPFLLFYINENPLIEGNEWEDLEKTGKMANASLLSQPSTFTCPWQTLIINYRALAVSPD